MSDLAPELLEGQDDLTHPSTSATSIKKFIFQAKRKDLDYDYDEGEDTIEVIIPERLEASYGLYVWPCAPLLAWYLFEHRNSIRGRRVLELGAGTALPGILCALIGADVTLSDSGKLPHCLEQSRKSVEANGLTGRVNVVGITWGFFLHDIKKLKGKVDLILGSDCFFDPSVFEDLIATIAYLLEGKPSAKFLGSYQERSSDWSIEPLLKKWGLSCKHIPLSDLAYSLEVDLVQIVQGHTIHVIEITVKPNP